MFRRRSPRLIGILLLPTALWSAVPAVRWCSLWWSQVPPQIVLRCLTVMDRDTGVCREGECPLARSSDGSQGCSDHMSPASAAPNDLACDVDVACPMSAEAAAPEETDAPGSTRPGSPAPATPQGRAYCLGDPAGGYGLQNTVAKVGPPTPVALVAVALTLEPPAKPTHWPHSESNARPPTRVWAAQPPIRAPPGHACS